MGKNWRLVTYSVHNAADNMAIDEAILDAHLAGESPPTLRLYGWKPEAVSIGYGQKISPAVEERIHSRGFDIVRRATGGRAVLHAHELTYSFVGSAHQGGGADGDKNSFLSDSVVKAYKQICEGLIRAFRELGLELSLGASSSDYRNAHDCFLATTSADLHYNGKKMIGSAQLRRRNAVLQHGSILLDQPQDLMSNLLRDSVSTEPASGTRHANLFDVLGEAVSLERLEGAMKAGFESAFEQTLENGELSLFEQNLLEEYRIRYQQKASSSN
jgi:lipoate-protein ligase A